ncbi:hypothetical protein GIB67_031356, partial [Kingdonia uniflora]
MAPQVPQVVGNTTSGTPTKASRSSVSNSDDFDEKGKLSIVQQRGRFNVTSESIAIEKGIPSPMLQKSHSLQGKTLPFLLHILESLTNGPTRGSRKTCYGRAPSVFALLPTRELAKQDHIERGNLDFSSLKFRVLDKVDEMLKMGFVDDVEVIL